MTAKVKLYTAAYLMEICYGLFLLLAALLAARVIENPFLLGLTGSLHVATRIVGNSVFGRWSDRVGRKVLLLPACGHFGLTFLILWSSSPPAIWSAYFLGGIANSIFWPLIEAWIGHGHNGEGLLRAVGLFIIIFTVGIATGNLVGGVFMKMGPGPACLIGGVILGLVALLLALTPEKEEKKAVPEETGRLPLPVRKIFLTLAWVANFATWIGIGIIRFLFPKLALKLHLASLTVGLINVTLYSSWAAASFFLMRWRGWPYRLWSLLVSQVVEAGALFLLWLFPTTPVFFVGFALFGVGAAMTYFASMFYGQDNAADRGTKSGYHEMILGLGMLAGPFLGGGFASAWGLTTVFAFAAATVLGAVGLEIFLYRYRRPGDRVQTAGGGGSSWRRNLTV